MNLLYATVPSFLSQVDFTFQKRSTNIVWSYKRSGLTAQRLGGPEYPIHIKSFFGRMGVCGLGYIICFLLSMAKDKNIFAIIEWLGNAGDSIIYYPTFKCLANESLFYSGAQEETQ